MRLAAAVVIVLVLGAGSASAQLQPIESERVTAGWVFTPAIAAGGFWDSNALLRVSGDTTGGGQWVGLVNPRGALDYNGRRTRLALGYSGGLEAYANVNDLTRYEQHARASLRHQATSRLFFTVDGSLSKTPTTERLTAANVLLFERVGARDSNVRGAAELRVARHTTATGEYSREQIQFIRGAVPTLGSLLLRDGIVHRAAGTVLQEVNSRLSVGGSYGRSYVDTIGDLIIHDISGVATYRYDERTSISGRFGYQRLTTINFPSTRSGPSIAVTMKRMLDERSRLDVSYNRTFGATWTSFGGGTTSNEIRATWLVPLPVESGRYYLQTLVAYRRSTPALSFGDQSRLHTWWTGATVGYSIAPWGRLEAFYDGSLQFTGTQSVKRARFGMQFVTVKPMRIQ